MPNISKTAAWKKAANTDRWTEILFRALSNRVAKRWRFISFRGASGGEWRGIVDVLAIRKDTSQSNRPPLKRGDLFEIVLVQMKGGSSRSPGPEDIKRLKAVKKHYHAEAIVLFSWKRPIGPKTRTKSTKFQKLEQGARWIDSSAAEIFG